MPIPALTPRRLILAGMGIAVAVFALYRALSEDEQENEYLYVIDARSDRSDPIDISVLFTSAGGKSKRPRVVVTEFESSQLIDSQEALAKAVEIRKASKTSSKEQVEAMLKRKVQPSEPFFIALDSPYSHTKKALRGSIDEQDRLRGADRVAFLRSIVPVIRADPYIWPDGCKEMLDDFAYIKWNFFAVGLVLNEAAIGLLQNCKPFGQDSGR
jgi:hypothetical protein